MESNEDSQSSSPDEPAMFRYVEVGMRLTYEFESLGQICTSLGHTIDFFPVISSRGWSTHKEFAISLRLVHFADPNREIGRCLLDQDEVTAWDRLFRLTGDCCSKGMPIRNFEYESRHGLRMVWRDDLYMLHVASLQPAILPVNFISQLLEIFDDFESLCHCFQ